MGNRNQETSGEGMDDMFDPAMGEFSDEAYEGLSADRESTDREGTAVEAARESLQSSEKHKLAEKRRRAEQRIEELRLREELGDYDLEFHD